MPYDLPDWLAAKIIPEPNSGCWLWLGAIAKGYGRIRIGRHNKHANVIQAHRFIYEFYNGPIKDDALVLDHLCRNRSCVNPSHCELVSEQTNILRGVSLSARYAKRTHCSKGHSLHDAYLIAGKFRRCRICAIKAAVRFKQRKRAG